MPHVLMSASQQLWRGALLIVALAIVFTFTEPRPVAGQPTTFVARYNATTVGVIHLGGHVEPRLFSQARAARRDARRDRSHRRRHRSSAGQLGSPGVES